MHDRVDFLAFRQLLQCLENSDVEIRLRTIGESWNAFSKLILVSDSAMIIQMHDDRRVILNIRNVVEFQLQKKFSSFEPNTVYQVAY